MGGSTARVISGWSVTTSNRFFPSHFLSPSFLPLPPPSLVFFSLTYNKALKTLWSLRIASFQFSINTFERLTPEIANGKEGKIELANFTLSPHGQVEGGPCFMSWERTCPSTLSALRQASQTFTNPSFLTGQRGREETLALPDPLLEITGLMFVSSHWSQANAAQHLATPVAMLVAMHTGFQRCALSDL